MRRLDVRNHAPCLIFHLKERFSERSTEAMGDDGKTLENDKFWCMKWWHTNCIKFFIRYNYKGLIKDC